MQIDLAPVSRIAADWGNRQDFLIEVMQDIQDEYKFLPGEVLLEVARILKIPLNHVNEVATFYKAFSLEPKGKYRVDVCLGTACHIQGAVLILQAFERELGIKMGETDENMAFSLDSVRCIGCCGLAPVVTVNEDVHGKVSSDMVPGIVEGYRKLIEAEAVA